MRAVVQRVSRAEVRVEGAVVGRIGRGLLALVAAGDDDGDDDVAYLADKVVGLRIFSDVSPPAGVIGADADQRAAKGQMNLSLREIGGGLLVVSQFTLFGDCRKGRRPSFVKAMAPGPAEQLYDKFVSTARKSGVPVETGRFRASMEVELVNDGPVTLLVDSKRAF